MKSEVRSQKSEVVLIRGLTTPNQKTSVSFDRALDSIILVKPSNYYQSTIVVNH